MRISSLFLCILLLSSCASYMNQRYMTSVIHTKEPVKVIYQQDTIESSNNTVKLKLERNSEPVQITVVNDSLNKTITISPKNSFAYYGNIFANYGIGMLVDKSNPKRYAYPKHLYINTTDTLDQYIKPVHSSQKGKLFWRVSIPYVNFLLQHPIGEGRRINSGFLGISTGLDFHYRPDQFLNFMVGASTTFLLPFPAAVDLSGEYEIASSIYFNLSNNHRIKRFSLGYGLSFSKNNWAWRYFDNFDAPPPTRAPASQSQFALGLNFPTYYRLGRRFHLGLIYRPSFLRFKSTERFRYEHLWTIDLSWKIGIKK